MSLKFHVYSYVRRLASRLPYLRNLLNRFLYFKLRYISALGRSRKDSGSNALYSTRFTTRHEFVSFAKDELDCLEIGPLHNPQIAGPRVKYFDIMDATALKEKAVENGFAPSRVPFIDFINDQGDLSVISIKFDYVFSSHVIEHQPNLIKHLRQVSELLKDEGSSYLAIIPDHRYCFDHFIHASNLSEIIAAFDNDVKQPSKYKVLEHWALTTHNDRIRHWSGDHGAQFENLVYRWNKAIKDFNPSKYSDVHCWQFTPLSFQAICNALHDLGYIDLKVANLWETRPGDIEFFVEFSPTSNEKST